MLFNRIESKNLIMKLNKIIFVLLIVCIFWYYVPGIGLPKLKEVSIDNVRILEGYPHTDPRYMQMLEIQKRVEGSFKNIEKFNVLGSYISYKENNTLVIETKKLNFFEIRIFKEKIFRLIGKRFNLRIENTKLPKDPNYIGKISKIDSKEQRILIINDEKKSVNTNKPVAIWFHIGKNTKIKKENDILFKYKTFEDLRVGQSVKVWYIGFKLDSYPAQAGEIDRIIIERNGK